MSDPERVSDYGWKHAVWRDWFAWRPVRLVSGHWRWLRWVQRTSIDLGSMDFEYHVFYREVA